MNKFGILIATATLGMAAGCQTPQSTDDKFSSAKNDGVDPRIGVETNRICFPRNINGWSTIDGDDDAIILSTGVSNDYRVEVIGACSSRDFNFAQKIGIENRPGGGCVTRGDVLLVEGPGTFVNRCSINRINEWNEDALAEDEAVDDSETY